MNLCVASTDDPWYEQAIHFYHGYLIRAYHYHASTFKGKNGEQLVCFSDPRPIRNEAMEKVVVWIQQHPEYIV